MKKLLLFFAVLLFSGSLFAQPPATGTQKAGKYQMNFPDMGTLQDSVVLWDGTTKILKYIPASAIAGYKTFQQIYDNDPDRTIIDSNGNILVMEPAGLLQAINMAAFPNNSGVNSGMIDLTGEIEAGTQMSKDNTGQLFGYVNTFNVTSQTGVFLVSDGTILQRNSLVKTVTVSAEDITDNYKAKWPDKTGNQIIAMMSDVAGASVVVDAVPTTGSSNAVSSGGTYNALQLKANDSAVVHNTGTETVAGVKTFSSTIVGSITGNADTVTTNANLNGDVISTGNTTSYNNPVPASKGGTGTTSLGSGVSNFLTTPTSANASTMVTDETGSGSLVFSNAATLVAPNLGTPTSVNLSNGTALPISGISGLGSGVGTFLATPSSTNMATAVTDETGSGSLVFANGPTLVNPVVGTQTQGDNSTKGASTAYVDTATAGLTHEFITDITDRTTTAVTGNQIISNITISPNTLKNSSFLNFSARFSGSGTNGTKAIAFYIGPNSNSLTGATQIALLNFSAAQLYVARMNREFTINSSGVLRGHSGLLSATNDNLQGNTPYLNLSLTLSNTYYLMTVINLTNSADVITQEFVHITSSK